MFYKHYLIHALSHVRQSYYIHLGKEEIETNDEVTCSTSLLKVVQPRVEPRQYNLGAHVFICHPYYAVTP